MSSEWQNLTLGDVTTWFSGGTPKKDNPDYWNGNIPWMSASSMDGTRYSTSALKITDKGLVAGSRLAFKDSILLLVRGSALHNKIPVGIALNDVAFNQDVKALVANTSVISPWFLLYWILSQRDYLLETVVEFTGIGAGKLDTKRMQALPLQLPPLNEQEVLVGVVRAIDDRIALLRETNATLEAIAQALFKSWFVDFDPVRAKQEGREPEGMDADTASLFPDSFEEPELGLVPKGWRMGVLGDIADTVRKQISPSELHSELYYVGLEHMPRHSLSLYSWDNADGLESAKAAFRPGDILFGKLRPYFHKVVIAPFAGVCSTDILVCRSKQTAFYGVILMHLFSVKLIEYASRLSNGAKMPRINWKDIAAYSICISPSIIADKYSKAVDPLFASMIANAYRIQTLASIRDTLLPRLISAQLRLPEAEAMIEEATA